MKAIATGLGALALGVSLALAPASSARTGYANVLSNDLSQCAPGKGPAVRLRITGLRSSSGNLLVRTYHARGSDWLKAKRYISRIDAKPRAGAMTVCVPVPGPGRYAIADQHDENGNREMDVSTDGTGMSNNPAIGSFLGIPRPPSVDKTAFSVGTGVTPLTITVRYRD